MKLLYVRSNVTTEELLENAFVNGLLNWFLDRRACFIDDRLRQDGREPNKLLSDMSKYSSKIKLQKSLGTGPSKWLQDKSIAWRNDLLPIQVGSKAIQSVGWKSDIRPVKLLPSRYGYWNANADELKTERGICPDSSIHTNLHNLSLTMLRLVMKTSFNYWCNSGSEKLFIYLLSVRCYWGHNH